MIEKEMVQQYNDIISEFAEALKSFSYADKSIIKPIENAMKSVIKSAKDLLESDYVSRYSFNWKLQKTIRTVEYIMKDDKVQGNLEILQTLLNKLFAIAMILALAEEEKLESNFQFKGRLMNIHNTRPRKNGKIKKKLR